MLGLVFLTTKLGCGQLYPLFTDKEMDSWELHSNSSWKQNLAHRAKILGT